MKELDLFTHCVCNNSNFIRFKKDVHVRIKSFERLKSSNSIYGIKRDDVNGTLVNVFINLNIYCRIKLLTFSQHM